MTPSPHHLRVFTVTGLSVLLLAGWASSAYLYRNQRRAHDQLQLEQLAHERTQGALQARNREVEELDELIAQFQRRKAQSDRQLESLQAQLAAQDKRLKELQGVAQQHQDLLRERAALLEARAQLAQQLEAEQSQSQTLVRALNMAQRKHEEYRQELDQRRNQSQPALIQVEAWAPFAESRTADRLMVTTHRENGHKLTVKSARTHSIVLSYETASPLDAPGQPLSVVLVAPSGRAFTYTGTQLETITTTTRKGVRSASHEAIITLYPQFKLKPGTYQLKLHRGDQLIGRAGFALR